MLGTKPPIDGDRGIPPDELQALIEEARSRARRRRRRYLVAAALVLAGAALAVLLVSGDKDSGQRGEQVGPSAAWPQSGIVDGTITFTLRGRNGAGTRTMQFEGPFAAPDAELPRFDLAMELSGDGEPSVSFSVLSTGDAAFLVADGRSYEVPPEVYGTLQGRDPLEGVALADWVDEGAASITSSGASRLDAEAMSADLREAAGALGLDAAALAFTNDSLTAREIDFARRPGEAQAISVRLGWDGRSDDLGRFEIEVSGDVAVRDPGAAERIVAPAEPQPLEGAPLHRFPTELWGLIEFLQGAR